MIRMLLISVLLIPMLAAAQQKPPVITSDKDSIAIGEQFHLLVTSEFQRNNPIQLAAIDSIPHFEILGRSKADSLEQGDKIIMKQTYTLTSFDSGRWEVPPVMINGYATKAFTIKVVFAPFDPKQDYHDIKDIIEVEKPAKRAWYWYVLFGALLLGILTLVFPSAKKTPQVKTLPVHANAYKNAMKDLDLLQSEQGRGIHAKMYYTRLTDILKTYLHKRKNIYSVSRTSGELASMIGRMKLAEGTKTKLISFLNESDLVKFAKYQPAHADIDSAMQVVRNSIIEMEKTAL